MPHEIDQGGGGRLLARSDGHTRIDAVDQLPIGHDGLPVDDDMKEAFGFQAVGSGGVARRSRDALRIEDRDTGKAPASRSICVVRPSKIETFSL